MGAAHPLRAWTPSVAGLLAGIVSTWLLIPGLAAPNLSFLGLWMLATRCTIPVFIITAISVWATASALETHPTRARIDESIDVACLATWLPPRPRPRERPWPQRRATKAAERHTSGFSQVYVTADVDADVSTAAPDRSSLHHQRPVPIQPKSPSRRNQRRRPVIDHQRQPASPPRANLLARVHRDFAPPPCHPNPPPGSYP